MRLLQVAAVIIVVLLGAQTLCLADSGVTSDWSQAPDLTGGLAFSSQANVPSIVADDWTCSESGMGISGLTWYGAFWTPYETGDPSPNSASFADADPGGTVQFHVNVWSNVAATQALPFAHPGAILPGGTFNITTFTQTLAGTDTGINGVNHNVYQYQTILPTNQFSPQQGVTYWLSIVAELQDSNGNPEDARQWGWLEAANDSHHMSAAVENFDGTHWYTLNNNLYSSDMAFTIQESTLGSGAPEPGVLALAVGVTGLLGLASRIRRKR